MSDSDLSLAVDHSGFASEYVASVTKIPEKVNLLAALNEIKGYNLTLYEVCVEVRLNGFISLVFLHNTNLEHSVKFPSINTNMLTIRKLQIIGFVVNIFSELF